MGTMHTLKRMPLLLLIVITNSIYAQTGSNPIFRDVFTADPAPMVYDGRLYVYVGHDEAFNDEMFNITEWLCYSTNDMINWTAHGSVMRPEDFKWDANDPNAVQQAWAAQCVHKDGKFYLYTTVTYGGRNVGVAVSDSPTGPFVDARGSALISDGMTNNGDAWDDIDPTVLIDDDGAAYLCWGNPNCYLAKLKPNMTELDGPIEIITPPNYGEGPWLSKRNGLYYLTYAAFPDPNGSEQICYATATNIHGPWTYQGIVSGPAAGSYTIHPGLVNYKGNDYLFYHDADYVIDGVRGTLGLRSVCVEYLCYNADGTMQPITHTDAGVTVPPPCPSNQTPIITFTSPENTAFVVPSTLTIDVNVTDPDGTISNVFYYLNDELILEEWVAPYAFDYTIETAGDYTLKAVATDDGGATSEIVISLSANVPQAPYGGVPHPIPGTIQLEEYDVGGNEFAYYDTDAGSNVDPAPDFRTDEDVDIETCADTGGGYNLGWTVAGEWLEYTVNVTKSGTYDIVLRASTDGDGKTISLSADGVSLANDVAVTNTAGWQEWTDVIVENVQLQAGEQVLKLTIGTVDYVNLNNITFTLQGDPVTIQLKTGWNLIGYPFTTSTTIEDALSSISENLLFVKDNDGYYDANSTPTLNSLIELQYGKGYYVKVDADCELEW
jgi:hypothetical protein